VNEAMQLSLGIHPAHYNQYLFSDHYLDSLLPGGPRWSRALPRATAFVGWLRDLYAQEHGQLPHYTESQLEDHWLRPILEQLGHTFERQASVPGLNAGVKRPDYVFFPDEAARQAAVRAQKTEEYVADALAVGEVKRWDVPLGKKGKGGGASFEGQNPSWQIDYYVRATGLKWGILSNGRRWRLVHQDSSQRLSIYYEVDLVELLSRDDAAAICYFVLFFRQDAFRPDAQGRVFLDDALAASNAYAVALEEDVERNVYQALERLMQGFLDLPANNLGQGDLRAIYDNSLYLLYRLLFILYGESRGLLPLQNDQYRTNYSLTRIKKDIAVLTTSPAPMTTIFWGRLKTLFHVINGDDPTLNQFLGVPRYDGGLFNPKLHPFLEDKAVGDQALVKAIDLLCRRMAESGHEFVDYRTLGVRHLGSIYEGLLEYQPRFAAEPMAATRDGKGERWVKADETPKNVKVLETRKAGQVYLATDRGERKTTGSYYTPQYIVEYIIQNTLGPLVDEAIGRVKARAQKAKTKAGRVEAAQSLVDEILGLKVLDPAMGSGHFLVEATEYLALALATDPYVEIDAPSEEDLVHWRRRVVERCIYGVDKNPLAVELAKLSLWLATVAADKPLSFLDHHLRCGDSLVGARAADLGWAPPVLLSKKAQQQLEQQKATQVNMFAYLLSQRLPVMLGKVLEITEVESDSYETVQAKEAAEQAVQQLKAPFEAVANLWASAYFGHEFTPGDYEEALGLLTRPDELLALPAVKHAQEMDRERSFFHWELAFPEVYYDQSGQFLGDRAGFDAVGGNPPYVRQEQVSSAKPFFSHAHSTVYDGVADLYVYFFHQGLESLRAGGRMSYIVTNKWLRASYGEALRGYFARSAEIERIMDFGHAPIFDDVDTFPCIIVLRKRGIDPEPGNQAKTAICLFPREVLGQVGLASYVQEHGYSVPMRRFDASPWSLERPEVDDLMHKISRTGIPLSEFVGSTPYRGILTGLNQAFLIDTATKERLTQADPRCADIIKPYLRGQDIKRWIPSWAGLWMILLKSSENHRWPWSEAGDAAEDLFAGTFPSIHRYLKPFEPRLRKRQDQGRYWWELRSCGYYEAFEQAKITYQEIQFHPASSFDDEGYLTNNKVFLLPCADHYLLAVLNSPLIWWYNWRYLPHMKDEALSPKGELMEILPIASPTDAIRADVEGAAERLISLSKEQQEEKTGILDWLRMEFGVEKPGQRLEAFASLSEDEFVGEVKRRRPFSEGRLKPAGLRALRDACAEHAPRLRGLEAENLHLEQRIATLVNAAYGLTPEEVKLLWRTAPPRMPIGPPV
jgi:hypothetical protein